MMPEPDFIFPAADSAEITIGEPSTAMTEPLPVSELKSVLVPRIFLQFSLTGISPENTQIAKAVEVHDYLSNFGETCFQISHLNTVPDGAAQMAQDLWKYYFRQGQMPLWFKNFTEDLEYVPLPL